MATASIFFSRPQVFAETGTAEAASTPGDFEGIIGTSFALESVLVQVKRVAPTDSTVMVLGETGTDRKSVV